MEYKNSEIKVLPPIEWDFAPGGQKTEDRRPKTEDPAQLKLLKPLENR